MPGSGKIFQLQMVYGYIWLLTKDGFSKVEKIYTIFKGL